MIYFTIHNQPKQKHKTSEKKLSNEHLTLLHANPITKT